MPNVNAVYRHHSGTKYNIVAISNQKATKDGWTQEAVYLDEDMSVWTRPAKDFDDETKFVLTEEAPFAKIEEVK